MTREDILNRIALKKYNLHFNQLFELSERVDVLNECVNELLEQVNLTIPDVRHFYNYGIITNEEIKSEKERCFEQIE